MSTIFSRTLQSLRADDRRPSLGGIFIALGLIGAWSAWLFLARVARIETSENARIEVERAAHRVDAPVEGKVAAVHLTLGAEVAEGDVLMELDDASLRLSLDEKKARRSALTAQLPTIETEIKAFEQALAAAFEAGQAEVGEAKARGREASAVASFQETEAQRAARLRGEGLTTEADAARISAEALAKRAAAEAQGFGALRIGAQQRSRGSEIRAEIARLRREALALDGERRALEATIDSLHADIARRRIVAPIAGRIGEIAALREGAFVQRGDLVAAIVPKGDLRVVAAFAPAVVGRLREGQTGQLRLDAFPWTDHGTVPIRVHSVATETQNGQVRVELTVLPPTSSSIPMQHGLSGIAAIEVDRVAPAILLLQAVGQWGQPARRETP